MVPGPEVVHGPRCCGVGVCVWGGVGRVPKVYTRKIPYICIGYIFPIFGEYMSLVGKFREHMSAKLIYLPGAQLSGAQLSGAQLSRGPTVRGSTVRLEKVDS